MGVEYIQEYIESEYSKFVQTEDLSSKSRAKPINDKDQSENEAVLSEKELNNVIVVQADNCFNHFYPSSADWVCGGQWSEMLSNVERFVRSFRQSNLELVVFFDGSIGPTRVFEWRTKHTTRRETVRQIISQVLKTNLFPSRRHFTLPAGFSHALRLALRACNVIVCSSLDEVSRDIISYSHTENCIGILAHNSSYLLCRVPNYFSSGHLKLGRNSVKAASYDFDGILKELCLSEEMIPLFASLLGNAFIPDGYLASFHWRLLSPDHPLKSVQLKVQYTNILPPNDVVVKGVLDYLKDKKAEDIESIAADVFKECGIKEGVTRLKESVSYYKERIATVGRIELNTKGRNEKSGFPIHANQKPMLDSIAAAPVGKGNQRKNEEHSYSKRWQQFQKVQVQPPAPQVQEKKQVDIEKDVNSATLNLQELSLKDAETIIRSQSSSEEETPTKDQEGELTSNLQHTQVLQGISMPFGQDNGVNSSENINGTVDESHMSAIRYADLKPILPTIPAEVLNITKKRHQNGQMAPEILQILTKGEIMLTMGIEEEQAAVKPPVPLIYRPIRQLIYGILYDQKIHDEIRKKSSFVEDTENPSRPRHVKEWCVYKGNRLDTPDQVEPKSISWDIPPVKNLWFGKQPDHNITRMRAFLTCMRSDTKNMTNTSMVPQRLLILCSVLRYLIQQEKGKSILSRQDIDAFLAQGLSPHLTTEYNAMNLANIKINQVDVRPMQIGGIFMAGVEAAILANDACGSPVPWEFCCPWIFFDGKLFHSKWLQSSVNVSTVDLCDQKPQLAEKLERLRWCITEGLGDKYVISGLQRGNCSSFFPSPFGAPPPSLLPGPAYGTTEMRPAGVRAPSEVARHRSRGPYCKRPILGSGGTLEVAGVPVAHWSGNKAGIGYKKDAPDVIVGGPNSVDVPSSHRRRGQGRGRPTSKGRGLLPTPIYSPWSLDFDYGIGMHSNYSAMKGVRKQSGKGIVKGKSQQGRETKAKKTVKQDSGNASEEKDDATSGQNPTKLLMKKSSEMWVGKGRGQVINVDENTHENSLNGPPDEKPRGDTKGTKGRGQWTGSPAQAPSV